MPPSYVLVSAFLNASTVVAVSILLGMQTYLISTGGPSDSELVSHPLTLGTRRANVGGMASEPSAAEEGDAGGPIVSLPPRPRPATQLDCFLRETQALPYSLLALAAD